MDWRLIPEETIRGPIAMARDEIAAETVAAGGPATVRLYKWEPSTVSLGYGNDADVVDWEYCADAEIDVTRRPTGGGAIYHDTTGDVAYSIIAPTAEYPGDVTECYRQLMEPVFSAFESVGADVGFADAPSEPLWKPLCYLRGLDPAHDLVGPDGRKIAGNAQYRTKDAIVQHGSLTFESDPVEHLGPFVEPEVTPEAFGGRVCGLTDVVGDLSRETFVGQLTDALASWADADPGQWTDDERERAAELAAEKYDHDRWVVNRDLPE